MRGKEKLSKIKIADKVEYALTSILTKITFIVVVLSLVGTLLCVCKGNCISALAFSLVTFINIKNNILLRGGEA